MSIIVLFPLQLQLLLCSQSSFAWREVSSSWSLNRMFKSSFFLSFPREEEAFRKTWLCLSWIFYRINWWGRRYTWITCKGKGYRRRQGNEWEEWVIEERRYSVTKGRGETWIMGVEVTSSTRVNEPTPVILSRNGVHPSVIITADKKGFNSELQSPWLLLQHHKWRRTVLTMNSKEGRVLLLSPSYVFDVWAKDYTKGSCLHLLPQTALLSTQQLCSCITCSASSSSLLQPSHLLIPFLQEKGEASKGEARESERLWFPYDYKIDFLIYSKE